MSRREEIELTIQLNRDQMHQISQFEPGGEGRIERLIARENDLYAELQELCDHKALAPEGFIAHHGPCPDCGMYFESLSIFAEDER